MTIFARVRSLRTNTFQIISLALASLVVGIALCLSAYVPAHAQLLGLKRPPSKDLQITINGKPYKFISGTTKASEIAQAFGNEATQTIKNPDGGRTLIWSTGEIVAPDYVAGPRLQSFVFNVDDQDTFVSETYRDDSNNQEARALRNKQLAVLYAKDKEMQANAGRAYNDAQMALLVIAGNTRCNWPVSALNKAKADAMVKAYRKYTNDIDYAVMLARQGETTPVEQNEFCFGPKWHGIFDNAAKALAIAPAP
jgi:hypothetical protein